MDVVTIERAALVPLLIMSVQCTSMMLWWIFKSKGDRSNYRIRFLLIFGIAALTFGTSLVVLSHVIFHESGISSIPAATFRFAGGVFMTAGTCYISEAFLEGVFGQRMVRWWYWIIAYLFVWLYSYILMW